MHSASSKCCNETDRKTLVPADDCDCCVEDDVCIEAKWTSRIPTSLTIVQEYAAPLQDRNGLPCFSKNDARVQFCEDGTPIGGLDTESDDPDNGLMVGQNDSDTVDTTEITSVLQNLTSAINQLIESNNNNTGGGSGGDNCSDILSQYNNLLAQYNTFIGSSDLNNCEGAENIKSNLEYYQNIFNDLLNQASVSGCDLVNIQDTVINIDSSLNSYNELCPADGGDCAQIEDQYNQVFADYNTYLASNDLNSCTDAENIKSNLEYYLNEFNNLFTQATEIGCDTLNIQDAVIIVDTTLISYNDLCPIGESNEETTCETLENGFLSTLSNYNSYLETVDLTVCDDAESIRDNLNLYINDLSSFLNQVINAGCFELEVQVQDTITDIGNTLSSFNETCPI